MLLVREQVVGGWLLENRWSVAGCYETGGWWLVVRKQVVALLYIGKR